MKIKVKTKEGAAQEFVLKGSVDEIFLEDEKEMTRIEKIWNTDRHCHEWIIIVKEKSTILKGQVVLFDNFNGLWITSKDYFVNVVSKIEAYIITEQGIKLAKCEIDANGNTELVGKLMERRVGEEEKTKEGKIWPKLQPGV